MLYEQPGWSPGGGRKGLSRGAIMIMPSGALPPEGILILGYSDFRSSALLIRPEVH